MHGGKRRREIGEHLPAVASGGGVFSVLEFDGVTPAGGEGGQEKNAEHDGESTGTGTKINGESNAESGERAAGGYTFHPTRPESEDRGDGDGGSYAARDEIDGSKRR
jgi:hypothetical protein